MLIRRADVAAQAEALQLAATSEGERLAYAAVLLSFGLRPFLSDGELACRLASLAANTRRADYHRGLALLAVAFGLDEYSLPELRRELLEVAT